MIEHKIIKVHNQYMSTFGMNLQCMCNNCDTTLHTNNLIRVRLITNTPISQEDISGFMEYRELSLPLDIKASEFMHLNLSRMGSLSIISDELINVPIEDNPEISMDTLDIHQTSEGITQYYDASGIVIGNSDIFSAYPDICTECESQDDISEGYMQISAPWATSEPYSRIIDVDKNHMNISVGDIHVYIDALPMAVSEIETYGAFSIATPIDFKTAQGSTLGEGFKEEDIGYREEFVRRVN